MRLLIFFVVIISITACAQNKQEQSLIGQWKLIAENGNNGANDYTIEIKDGEILHFLSGNKIKNNKGDNGTYQLNNNKLMIQINQSKKYYLIFYDDDNSKIMYLNPVTEKYQIICDEGCSFTYKKIK